jgi:hypothetical protein
MSEPTKAALKKPDSAGRLLFGLSVPAFLCTNGEIYSFGRPYWFITLNATAVLLIVMLAFLRDKRTAKQQEILKDL